MDTRNLTPSEQRAWQGWEAFTSAAVWATASIVVVLALMAAFLL